MRTLGSSWHTACLFLSCLEHLCNSGRQSRTELCQRPENPGLPLARLNLSHSSTSLALSCLHAVPSAWEMIPHCLSGKTLLISECLQSTFSRTPPQHSAPCQAGLGGLPSLEQLPPCIIIAHLWTRTHPAWGSAQPITASTSLSLSFHIYKMRQIILILQVCWEDYLAWSW